MAISEELELTVEQYTPYPVGAKKTSTLPKMDGNAYIGDELTYAAGDHVHPSDTTKIPKTAIGAADGVCPLDESAKIKEKYIPDSIPSEFRSVEEDITLLSTRVDEIIAPSGEAPSVAEVTDARIGIDSTVYSTLGESIRSQVDFLSAINSQALIANFPTFTSVDFEIGALSQSGEVGSPYTIRTKNYYALRECSIKFTGVLGEGRYCYPYFYDKNFSWISRYTGDWTEWYSVPDNAVYVRFVHGFTSSSGQTVEEYGFNNLVSDFGVELYNNTIKGIDENIDYIQDGAINNAFSNIASRYIAYETGVLTSNSNYHATSFIAIPKYTKFIETNCLNSVEGTDGYAFYDSAQGYLSGGKCQRYGVTRIVVPNGAKYIRLCSRNSYEAAGVDRYVKSLVDIQKKSNTGYTVVMLGDSLIGNYNDDTSVPVHLEEFSGAKCYNCAFGGSNLGTDTVGSVNQLLLPFRGFKVIEAIVNNDYSEMDAAIASDPEYTTILEYYADHVATLKRMDWSKVDIITMSWGTNDWGTSVTLADNAQNLKDTNTLGGALRTALETLWATYPHIKVMICGVVWRGGTISDGSLSWESDTHTNGIGAYLEQYEEKEKAVAKEYHVPFVEMYNYTNINIHTWKNYFPTSGSNATHPNAKGRYVMARRYAQHLAEL